MRSWSRRGLPVFYLSYCSQDLLRRVWPCSGSLWSGKRAGFCCSHRPWICQSEDLSKRRVNIPSPPKAMQDDLDLTPAGEIAGGWLCQMDCWNICNFGCCRTLCTSNWRSQAIQVDIQIFCCGKISSLTIFCTVHLDVAYNFECRLFKRSSSSLSDLPWVPAKSTS